ncbi:hypothetical protein ERN12_14885 [Rhodobacteraceae bacterium]|nr:hypothetical protein ERN12_14885 [Paracoccaceae bacterium]
MTIAKNILTGTILSATALLPLAAVADATGDDTTGLAAYKMGIVDPDEMNTSSAEAAAAADYSQSGDQGGEEGLAEIKTQANDGGDVSSMNKTSSGEAALPSEEQLKDETGILDNKTAAGSMGSVVSADASNVGTIERVVNNGATDTIYIRVSEGLDTPVSMFRVDVPSADLEDGVVELPWTLSALLESLEKQQDM